MLKKQFIRFSYIFFITKNESNKIDKIIGLDIKNEESFVFGLTVVVVVTAPVNRLQLSVEQQETVVNKKVPLKQDDSHDNVVVSKPDEVLLDVFNYLIYLKILKN